MQSCPSCLFHQPLTCSTSSIPGRHVLQRWLDKCLLHWFKSDSVADVACRAWTSVPTRTPTQRICMCSAAVRCTWKSRIICSETKGSRVPASCIILYHLVSSCIILFSATGGKSLTQNKTPTLPTISWSTTSLT